MAVIHALLVWPGSDSGGGGGVNPIPGVGVLTLTGYAPTVSTPVTVTPGVGALVLTGFPPSVATPVNTQPGVGALTLTGYAPLVTTTAVRLGPAQSPTQLLFLDANNNPLANNVLAIKTGETGTRRLKLTGHDGTAEDLTTASNLVVTVTRRRGGPLVRGRSLMVIDATNGIVSFQQQAGDFPAPGTLSLEVQITRADGSIGQFPELGYAKIEVTKSLTS